MGRSFVINKYYDVPNCLFCGGNTVIGRRKLNYYDEKRKCYVRCTKCNARGPIKDTPEEAIEFYVIN